MDYDNLTNHFLIAMPALHDPNFFHTVTYICVHNEDGAMGIVINRPLDELLLGDIFKHMNIIGENERIRGQSVFLGGPVEPERGFVLHTPAGHWDGMLQITPDLGVSTSREILNAMAAGHGPEKTFVALGYAGWGAGQLEEEMAENAWLSCPATDDIIFELPPEQRWQAAAGKLGIDLNLISSDAGHG